MRKGILGVLGTLLTGAAPLFAQTALPSIVGPMQPPMGPAPMGPIITVPGHAAPGHAAPPVGMPVPDHGAPPMVALESGPTMVDSPFHVSAGDEGLRSSRMWGSADYMLWWVKNSPIPLPLVTRGDSINDLIPGAIGQPGTTGVFGPTEQSYGRFGGGKLTVGGWMDCEQRFGVEMSGFLLEQRTRSFFTTSDATGNPSLFIPFNETDPNFAGPNSLVLADPNFGFAGTVAIRSSLQLWGTEVNGLVNLYRKCGMEINALVGFRYLDLRENLQIDAQEQDLILGTQNGFSDSFNTRNQFYGVNLGLRAHAEFNKFSVDVTGKVALGNTHEVVDIQGRSVQFSDPANGAVPGPGAYVGGIFAQQSNIGRRTSNVFSVIPAVELKVGYQITQSLRATVGYDYMSWNNVVRPGNQIDRNINTSQSSLITGIPGGIFAGPNQPAASFNRSDFWAQGVTFGVEFRY